MNKMLLKYKILVNGLNISGDYTIDGFTLKKGIFDMEIFDKKYINDVLGININ